MIEIIKPGYEIRTDLDADRILLSLEEAARTCYKSEGKICEGSAEKLIAKLINDYKHESVIEHESVSVRFICDRGVTHEMVRHRIASFSQESTRYVNYSKRGSQIILPPWVDECLLGIHVPRTKHTPEVMTYLRENEAAYVWFEQVGYAITQYDRLIALGWKPQQARSVLPNSLKTEIVMTANLREWRKVFQLRTAQAAHPQIREIMTPLLKELKTKIPVIFDDIVPYEAENG